MQHQQPQLNSQTAKRKRLEATSQSQVSYTQDEATKPDKKRRQKNWTASESELLVALRFGERTIADGFISTRDANDLTELWKVIASKIGRFDHNQCKERFKTITAEYNVSLHTIT